MPKQTLLPLLFLCLFTISHCSAKGSLKEQLLSTEVQEDREEKGDHIIKKYIEIDPFFKYFSFLCSSFPLLDSNV